MNTTIIATKLYIPPLRSNSVLRPRLTSRLNEGLQCKLTMISAPAGFGKTTLVSEWIAGSGRPVAWLSLDSEDNDLARFLVYLVSSLQTIPIRIGDSLSDMLESPQPASPELVLTILLNEISSFPDHFFLVLDDYHVIDAKPVNDAVAFLLEHLPQQMHLVIATREDPPFALARMRARDQLNELRAADLRFSFSEAAVFLSKVMDLSLSDKDIENLEHRTEGWIAGLQLAAVSMQGQADPAGFIRAFTGSHRYVLDYLIEEVLQRQPGNVQSFLLRTSILDRMSGDLCDAVLLDPSASGQETLEYLDRSNLFIVPLDNERRWYRYHHLFCDLLRQRLPKEFPSAISNEGLDVAQLHIRASKWFEVNGLISEAVNHAVIAKDFERAATLIELAWAGMDKTMKSAAWLSWVKMIPEELVCLRPVLSAGYAWALLDTGEFEGCEKRLQDAEIGMDKLLSIRSGNEDSLCNFVVADEEQFCFLSATLESARAYRASALGDIKATIMHARKALDLNKKEDYHRKTIVDALLGLALWANGELEAAFSTVAAGVVNIQMEIMFAVVLAELRIEQGSFQKAFRIYEKSLQAAAMEEAESYQIPIASFYLGLGRIKLLKGDIKGAEVLLKRSKEQGEKAALPNWRYNWYLLQAEISGSQGNHDQALDLLSEAERYYFRSPIPEIHPMYVLKTRVLIRQGKIINTKDWMNEHELTMEDELGYLREFEHITLVRVLLSEYRRSHNDKSLLEAKQWTERLLIEARKGQRVGSVVEILISQALAHEAIADMELAIKSLEEALRLAEPEEHFQIFVDENLQMHRLLSELVPYKIMPDYVSKLLAAIEARKGVNESGKTPSKSSHGLMEPLSKREMEILQLIMQGFSNHEISRRLFLALSTVKGYNQKLFEKLQVNSRAEAIARSHELKLL